MDWKCSFLIDKINVFCICPNIYLNIVDVSIIIIKVQAIWDSLDADSLAVEDIDEQKIAEVFFSVGNKLDMAQIDNFYTKVSVVL